ncbi:hypothetical protein BH11MYX1_BH11MYX1_42870 [soil metagenome]
MSEFERVLSNPRSVQARLELLDAWERDGDPRAEVLRLQVRGYLFLDENIEFALLARAARIIYRRGVELAGPVSSMVEKFRFELGLVMDVTISASKLQASWRAMQNQAPIIAVYITDPADDPTVANNPLLAQIVHLRFSGRGIDDNLAVAIASNPDSRELRNLSLRDGSITRTGFEALAASRYLPNLISIDLTGNPCQEFGTQNGDDYYWIGEAAGEFLHDAQVDQISAVDPTRMRWPPSLFRYAWIDDRPKGERE